MDGWMAGVTEVICEEEEKGRGKGEIGKFDAIRDENEESRWYVAEEAWNWTGGGWGRS